MKTLFKPLFLSLLSGLLFCLSWPTYGFSYLLFFAFVPLLFLEKKIRFDNRSRLKIIGYTYLTFLLWNSITTGWLYYASLFGVLFAVLVNTLLMSLVFLSYHVIAKKASSRLALLYLITIWLTFEKLHLEWEFSWPWLNLGHVFSENPKYIQWYEYTGTFGGSLWVLLVNILLFGLINDYLSVKRLNKYRALALTLVITLPISYSLFLYNSYQTVGTSAEVVVIQPNVDPYTEKYGTTNSETIEHLIEQTESLITLNTAFVITPETVLTEGKPLREFDFSVEKQKINTFLNRFPNTSLLIGIDTYDILYDVKDTSPSSNQVDANVWVNFYNAALFVENNTRLQKHFKSKLVVGVENLPYKSILEPLISSFMIDLGGTMSTRTSQDKPTVFWDKNKKSVAPVICYESIYGEYVTQYALENAGFLAIMTNDAWWNDTQGHKQHLSLARLRAIETRKDIARSANTGISAFINQRGDITSQSLYNEKTALKGTVHLNTNKTFYVIYGDYIARIAFLIALIIAIVSLTRRKK